MSAAGRRVRPRDAASLLLYDSSGGKPRFLMGVRAASHLFMPGHLVFPGGGLEPSDIALARHLPMNDVAAQRVMLGSPRMTSPRRAAALALAAIRETQEETGLLVARSGAMPQTPPGWEGFAAAGAVPSPNALMPLARAITPPGLPRRFDARFFLAPADSLMARHESIVPPTDEFDTVLWIASDALKDFRIAPITALVLEAASRRIDAGADRDPAAPIPFFRRRGGRHIVEYL